MNKIGRSQNKNFSEENEEILQFIPEDSPVILKSRKKTSFFSYLSIAICALIIGVFVSLSVVKRKVDCLHLHVEQFSAFFEPPPHSEIAKVARYIIHTSDWCSLSTFSTHKNIEGYPFVNVFSFSDGPRRNSTGIPYFYATNLDLSLRDIKADNRVSITVTESQSGYCRKRGYDPQSPLCGRVILTGNFTKIEPGAKDEKFAQEALFSRHPEMPNWPSDHNFFFGKLNISVIHILDYFGGAKTIPLNEYFAASPYP